jgi:hypothetical protein
MALHALIIKKIAMVNTCIAPHQSRIAGRFDRVHDHMAVCQKSGQNFEKE